MTSSSTLRTPQAVDTLQVLDRPQCEFLARSKTLPKSAHIHQCRQRRGRRRRKAAKFKLALPPWHSSNVDAESVDFHSLQAEAQEKETTKQAEEAAAKLKSAIEARQRLAAERKTLEQAQTTLDSALVEVGLRM